MNVKLTTHAAELLETVRAQNHEPVERILEHALEVLVRQENIGSREATPDDSRRQAVRDVLDFIQHNRVHLGAGLSVRDLIHEGHRV